MNLRVTPNVISSNTIFNAQRTTAALALLQEEASSGLRLNNPSDGPVDMVTVLANKAQDLRLGMYQTNLNTAQSTLNLSVSTLQDVSSILAQAKQIAIEGSNAVNDGTSNAALAEQIDGLLSRLEADANTQSAGQYLYAGTASQSAPFTVAASGAVTYMGDPERSQTPIGPGQTVSTFYAGSEVFQTQQRAATAYTGATGATAGTGTDSATGQGTLLVTHTITTYQAGSGVQAGTGSTAGDTIIGPAGSHTLTLVDTSGTGVSGTIALDGGPAVAFSSTDTNLQVAGPQGEAVFVNTSAITPGFNGTVAITANGTLSTDNGATQVPINFSANQVVTNSATGAVTNVNSTNIRAAGTDQVSYTGSYDAFQILSAIASDLRDPTLTDAQRSQSLSNRLGELDRVHTGVLNVVGEQSTSLANMSVLQTRYQNVQLELEKVVSNLESADISQIVIGLQSQQNLLQATLASAAQINSLSLVNFLH